MSHKILFIDHTKVEQLIEASPDGKNTRFLSNAHSLWYRFKNYEKSPVMAYEHHGEIVSLIFATFNRDGYANLYEIVTLEGKEGKGHASRCWDEWIKYAVTKKNVKRLKMSCTPSSVTWHYRNGLIFWAVDPTGSLRSDQPLFATCKEQMEFREFAKTNPTEALPPLKAVEQFRKEGLENYAWSDKKKAKTQAAIDAVGSAWLRDALIGTSSLEDFLE